MSIDTVIKEGPAHALVVVPPDDSQKDSAPDDSWSLDDLRQYALDRLGEVNLLARRSTVQTYRAGWALSLASNKEKCKREWGRWQSRNNLPRTSVWEAIKLYERAPSEEAIKDLTPQQAKEKYKIVKKRENTGGGPSGRKNGPRGDTPHPPQDSSRALIVPPVGGPEVDVVARHQGEGGRQAVLSGKAQLSPDEIRTLAGGKFTDSGPRTPVVVVVPSPQAARQDQPAPVGLLEHRDLAGVVGDTAVKIEDAGEEMPDEVLLGQAADLFRRMNLTTRLAFVAQPLVLAAVRRLPRDLTTAA